MTLEHVPFDPAHFGIDQPYGPRGHSEHGSTVWESFLVLDATAGKFDGHNGIDVPLPDGSPLYAPRPGVAHLHWSWTIPGKPTGWAVSIDHDDGTETLFGHVSAMKVGDGQNVSAGQLVALSGGVVREAGAGFSTGAHLHLERHSRPSGPTFNPYDELRAVIVAHSGADALTDADKQWIAQQFAQRDVWLNQLKQDTAQALISLSSQLLLGREPSYPELNARWAEIGSQQFSITGELHHWYDTNPVAARAAGRIHHLTDPENQ